MFKFSKKSIIKLLLEKIFHINNNDEIMKDLFLSRNEITFYDKLIQLAITDIKNWILFSYVFENGKRLRLINEIEFEIRKIKEIDYILEKKLPFIYNFLGQDVRQKNFSEAIIQNLYIAKLQNIKDLLQKCNRDSMFSAQENEMEDFHNEIKDSLPTK